MGVMNWKRNTVLFVSIMFVLVLVYDTVAIVNGGTESSISHLFVVWSYNYPAFTFLFGFVMGHLFWRMRDTNKTSSLGSSYDIPKD